MKDSGRTTVFPSLAAVGLVMAVAGLAWDAAMHAADAQLASHEGVFTLGNPSHALFLAGLVVTATGIGGAIVRTLRGGRRPPGWALPLTLLALGLGSGAAIANAGDGHDHGATASHQASASHPTGKRGHHGAKDHAQQLPVGASHGFAHSLAQYPDMSLASASQRAAAQRIYDESVRTAARFKDPGTARAAGYKVDPEKTGKNGRRKVILHAGSKAYKRDGKTLDTSKPETLVYANPPDGKLTLIGVLYRAPKGQPGPTPGGPITRWHFHEPCFMNGQKVRGGKDGACPAGAVKRRTAEMMHVWFTGDLRSAYAIHAPRKELRERYGDALPTKGKRGSNAAP
ncbi:MAG: hypothetical protein DLM61_18270 [Pseudonocardiales bacterium]|nr:MAG: hypothetical protein DLM61_18270 [Pseudonocardiales bacterium]